MKTPTYSPLTLERLLQQNEIATFDELKSVLGNPARATVFRKLAELDYLSSYSHRGRYYTMRSIARFSAVGLWSCRAVWFSRYGNLLDTAQALVEQSAAGYSALELKTIVQVKTKHALKDLTDRGRLQREKIGAQYIYLAADDQAAQQQRRTRESDEPSLATVLVINPDLATEEAKATILLFCSLLDEKQRRLYAGLESLKLGYGGDAHIGALLGMDPHTVARGRRELVRGDFSSDGVRAKGGGRLPQEKKHRIS